MAVSKEEHRQIIIKSAVAILRKEFNDLSLTSNLCTLSGFHTEAKAIAKAMMLVEDATRQLIERQEVE